MAVCLATSGSVQCFCRPGYHGNAVGPMGCLPGSSSGPNVPDSGSSSGGGGVVLSPCATQPCQNGATCFPLATSFMCQCSPGYEGTRCNREIDECASIPCLNGATCADQLNGYRCTCDPNYQGINCQDEVLREN
jgi:hypothetical protein